MIAVFGATGRVGRQVVEGLLKRGASVRAIGRSPAKLEALERLGAKTMAADARDTGSLSRAFADADAAFILMPHDVRAADYHVEQDLIGSSLTAALDEAKTAHVVFLSSVGAEQSDGTGVVSSLHRQERRLEQLSRSSVLMLRAGYFYENFHESLPLIREQGILAEAIDAQLPVPMVATRDIASTAVDALLRRDWHGKMAREIHGPVDLIFSRIATIIGSKIGRPELTYVQLPYDALIDALEQAGLSHDVATQYVGLSRGINEGRVAARTSPELRHVGTTAFETFADELAIAYRQAGS